MAWAVAVLDTREDRARSAHGCVVTLPAGTEPQ
jgi:hypothetical protein